MTTEIVIYTPDGTQVTQEDYDRLTYEVVQLRLELRSYKTVMGMLKEEIIKFKGNPIVISQSRLN